MSERSITASLRRALVDSPNSVGAKARARRWAKIVSEFPDLESMSVLDLGGTVETWRRAPVRPAGVTVVNLFEPGESDDDSLVPVMGDACSAAAVLTENQQPTSFDLVFSNSLLEHVGGHAKRAALAEQIHHLAPLHWVQTPYRFFPVEPHWLFPGMQFLPVRARMSVAERWPLAHTRPESSTDALNEVQWTELIGVTELRSYFPNSQIFRERVAGVTKSITAIASRS